MKNDQPFTPQSSLLDVKQPGRSRVKIAVFSVLALHVAGLTALLLTQGCKREVPPEIELPPEVPMLDTNLYYTDTNLPPYGSETNAYVPPVEDPYLPPVTTPPVVSQSSEYVVKSGDSFYTIAKNNGTTVKAIESANPGVDSRRLKIGQKLVLPAPGASATPSVPGVAPLGDDIYVVKSGDNLTRIADRHNTTVKELKSLNGLSTDRINVGQKLKLPAPPAPAPVPMADPLAPAPLAPPPGQ